MLDEHMVIAGLVGQQVEKFKHDLISEIDLFYKRYDPIKSLDRTFVVKMISSVYLGLEKILNEVQI